jgi:hypothetical protein
MYEINILPLNYPGLFILFINPTLESIIYYLSKILFKNDLEYEPRAAATYVARAGR